MLFDDCVLFDSMQPARKLYESLLGDGVNATALSHIQVRFGRFMRHRCLSKYPISYCVKTEMS